jgi:hypothetical protein
MWLPMGSDKAQRGNEKGNTRDTGSRVRDRKGAGQMQQETLETKKEYTKEYSFILGLRGAGIPLSAINTNDYQHSPSRYVYITIPYGKNNGGKTKEYKRFSNRDLVNAVKFWNKSEKGQG